jgi:hypothetical protein
MIFTKNAVKLLLLINLCNFFFASEAKAIDTYRDPAEMTCEEIEKEARFLHKICGSWLIGPDKACGLEQKAAEQACGYEIYYYEDDFGSDVYVESVSDDGIAITSDEYFQDPELENLENMLCEHLKMEFWKCKNKAHAHWKYRIRDLWESYYPRCGKCKRSIAGVNIYNHCELFPEETPDYRPGCEKGWDQPVADISESTHK